MASETTVGGIVGTLRLSADQFHREMERAIAEADRLDGKNVDVNVKADTAKAQSELGATAAAADRVDRSNVRVAQSGRDAGRGMGALATAVITLGPAIVPLASATVALAAGFGAMGSAGILAVVGIRNEMQKGTATGQAFSTALDSAKGNLNALGTVAAKGVLRPFQDAVANLSRQMPDLSRMIGEFAGVTGRTAGNIMSGLVQAFIALEPLMRDVSTYTFNLAQRFALLMSGSGVVSFGDYVRSVFPQVMRAVEDIVGAAIHLVAALAPLGGGILTMLQTFAQVISAIPVDVLATLATVASAAFLGFKSYGLITGLVEGVSGALVKMGLSAESAAVGMRALNFAAGAIGALIGVATFLYARHAESVRQDQDAVNSLTDALIRNNGAIDDNAVKDQASKLAKDGTLAAAKALGYAMDDVTLASLGNADATARVNARTAELRAAYAEAGTSGGEMSSTLGNVGNQIKKVTDATKDGATHLGLATEAYSAYKSGIDSGSTALTAQDAAQAALASRLGTTTTALQAATTAQQSQADSAANALALMQRENDAAGILKGTLDQLNGKALSAADAQNAFDSSLANMGDHVTAAGKKIHFTTTSIDNMSSASVALRGQLNGQISNLQRVVEANGGLANSTGKAREQMKTMRQQIIDNAVAHGVDRAAVTKYIDKLLAIPKKVPPTKLDVDNAAALTKISALKTALADLHGKTVQVTVNEQRFVNNGPLPGGGSSMVGGQTKNSANGNIFKAFAAGGFENHIAQIAPAGAMRLWAEPETGGEAYIPLAPSKRGRSQAILNEVNRMFGNDTVELGSSTIAAIAAAVSRVKVQTSVSASQFDRAMMAGMRA